MNLYNPTRDELAKWTWTTLLEMARNKFVVLTTDQYADILARKITGTTDLLERVQQLFETKPIIGFTNDGNVVLRTYGNFNADELNMTFTWITAWYIGTVTNTDQKVTTVDINFETVSTVVSDAIHELLSITTDDLLEVPLTFYTHNLIGLTKGGIIYFDHKVTNAPVPQGSKWVAGLMLLSGNGTNSVKAIDDKGMEHSGQWDIENGTVIYDATTVPGNVRTTPTTPTTI